MREISKMVVWEERARSSALDHQRHVFGCGCAETPASGRGCIVGSVSRFVEGRDKGWREKWLLRLYGKICGGSPVGMS